MTDYTVEIIVNSLTKETEAKITAEDKNGATVAIPDNLLQIIATGGDASTVPDTPHVAEAEHAPLPKVTVWDYDRVVHERLKTLVLAGCVTFPASSSTNSTRVEMVDSVASEANWYFRFKISDNNQVTDRAHINAQLCR